MNQPDIRALIEWSRGELKRLHCCELLKRGFIKRMRIGLGGSHTVATYPPLDALEPLNIEELLPNLEPVEGLNLYLHIPYCEHLCPFCHYITTYTAIGDNNDRIRSYLDALFAEMDHWAEKIQGSTLSSLYVGGGTPTAISENNLIKLFEKLATFKRNAGFKACVETSPITTTSMGGDAKLRALLEAGVNRISIGIQTFDPILLRRTRGHSKETALKALEIVMDLGVEVNVDMIQDLPNQSDESLVNDIAWINRFKPDQVTWYLLRMHQDSSWYHMHKRADLDLPDALESARRRLLIREAMNRIGYVPKLGGRFVREASLNNFFKEVRIATDYTLLGMGISAYSHGWGYFFRNTCPNKRIIGIRGYVDCIHKAGFAVESGCRLTPVEKVASSLVAGIRTSVVVPEPTPETEGYLTKALSTLHTLREAGLVDIDSNNAWSLTDLGNLFEEEICSMFYSSSVVNRLEKNTDS